MKCFSESHVELVRVSSVEHSAKIIAIGPVSLCADLFPYTLVERRTWQRIGNRDSDVVRACGADKFDGLLNVFPIFSRVAKLQKVTGSNVFVGDTFSRSNNFCQAQTLIHCVEDFLRSRFDTHPHFDTACALEGGYGRWCH